MNHSAGHDVQGIFFSWRLLVLFLPTYSINRYSSSLASYGDDNHPSWRRLDVVDDQVQNVPVHESSKFRKWKISCELFCCCPAVAACVLRCFPSILFLNRNWEERKQAKWMHRNEWKKQQHSFTCFAIAHQCRSSSVNRSWCRSSVWGKFQADKQIIPASYHLNGICMARVGTREREEEFPFADVRVVSFCWGLRKYHRHCWPIHPDQLTAHSSSCITTAK